MGGDGIIGAVAGELRDGKGLLAVLPGGRGNDFARKLEISHDPVEAAKLLQTGQERRIDLAEAGGQTYLGILSAGFDSDVSRIALETRLKLGTFVYTYGVLRAILQLARGVLERHDRRRAGLVRRLLGRGRELGRVRRRHVPRARRRSSTTACSTS